MRAARRAGWPVGPGSPRRLLRGGPPPHGRRRARGWEAAHPGALVAGHARRRPAPHAGVRRADGRLARRSSLGCRRGARFRRAPVRGARGRAVQRCDGHDQGDRGPAASQLSLMSDLALYRRLLRQARPYWLHLALLFCIGVLASPIALLNPVPLKIVVDSVIGTRPLPPAVRALLPETIAGSPGALLAAAVGLLLAVAALAQLQALANKFMQAYVGERLVLGFRTQLA